MEVSFSPHENYNAQIPYVGDIDPTTPGASRPRRAWGEGAFYTQPRLPTSPSL